MPLLWRRSRSYSRRPARAPGGREGGPPEALDLERKIGIGRGPIVTAAGCDRGWREPRITNEWPSKDETEFRDDGEVRVALSTGAQGTGKSTHSLEDLGAACGRRADPSDSWASDGRAGPLINQDASKLKVGPIAPGCCLAAVRGTI